MRPISKGGSWKQAERQTPAESIFFISIVLLGIYVSHNMLSRTKEIGVAVPLSLLYLARFLNDYII